MYTVDLKTLKKKFKIELETGSYVFHSSDPDFFIITPMKVNVDQLSKEVELRF
jgi:hypothetical protein